MAMSKVILRLGVSRNKVFAALMSSTSNDTRNGRLKKMLASSQLEFLMEAHSALSAKIVEETGFKVSSARK